MDIRKMIYERARAADATIIIADAGDERVKAAAAMVGEEGLAKLIMLETGKSDAYITDDIIALVQSKIGGTQNDSKALLHADTRYLAAALVEKGIADGYIAGHACATRDTIRPALKIIGTTHRYASSYMIMVDPKTNQLYFYADVAFNIEPNPQELAKIAIDTATSAKLYGVEPRVAFLSFSTHGSAEHAAVTKMREAYGHAKALAPDLIMDGEIQYDAAINPAIAQKKTPNSPLQGRANVLIFPDLDSGNIAYKAVQQHTGYSAIGPVFQGFNKPVNDLSRGCSVQDMVDVIAITAMQKGGKDGN